MTSSNNPMAMLMNMMRPQMPQMQSVQSQNQPIDKERFMTGVKQLNQIQLQFLKAGIQINGYIMPRLITWL